MFKIKAIPHKELTCEILDEIIWVKSSVWPYPSDEQKKWIKNNIKDDDIHFLLYNASKAVAYLNLIDIEIEVDNQKEKAFGIGNVCAIEKGKGYGKELMKQVNQFIIKSEKTGLLFCKNNLTPFYQKYGWKLINKNLLVLSLDIQNIETMALIKTDNISSLKYKGNAF
ncbi:GNAT family N-acetyltransferase [Gaoshiqia sp. Z1-71]|uniref:GNAT family N-acetyltransferase n=1 Tax=Gaoshiqia hydrogeniformans TaxID=3290090 RepID=UPI003BF79694